MTNPRVLLLDEPVEGLAPIVVVEMLKVPAEVVHHGHMLLVNKFQIFQILIPVTEE